jgi:hypothetical protein
MAGAPYEREKAGQIKWPERVPPGQESTEPAADHLTSSLDYWRMVSRILRDNFGLTVLPKLGRKEGTGITAEQWVNLLVTERDCRLDQLLERDTAVKEAYDRFLLAKGYMLAVKRMIGDADNLLVLDDITKA